jgi:hypothetical protein
MLVRKLLQSGSCLFSIHLFGEYTHTFVMHIAYDILVVVMVVYDMQVWCDHVLSKGPLKFMIS